MKIVDSCRDLRQIQPGANHRPKGSPESRTHKCRGEPLSGYIGNDRNEAVRPSRDNVDIVTADLVAWTELIRNLVPGYARQPVRKKASLDLPGGCKILLCSLPCKQLFMLQRILDCDACLQGQALEKILLFQTEASSAHDDKPSQNSLLLVA